MNIALALDTKLWAKISKKDPTITHPVICHSLDVGAAAWELWNYLSDGLRERLCRSFKVPDSTLRKWVALIASMHDLGKITPAFQKKCRDKCDALWIYLQQNYSFENALDTPHNISSQCIIPEFGDGVFSTDVIYDIGAILGAHHGVFSPHPRPGIDKQILMDLGWLDGKDRWRIQQKNHLEFLVDYWEVKGISTISHPSRWNQWAYMVLTGFISFCDWVASSQIPKRGISTDDWEPCFPPAGDTVDPDKYGEDVKVRIKYVLRKLDFWKFEPEKRRMFFQELFPDISANDLQQQCDTVFEITEQFSEPCMVIIEDSTGSGKTEAALYLAQLFMSMFGHAGLYVAMPTCASTDQMVKRCAAFIKKVMGEDQKADMQVLQSHASLSLRKMWEEVHGDISINDWLSRSGRTKLFNPFGVGTVDQACMGVIQTKFFTMRLMGLANKVIILDEIHCYDHYTSEIIRQLIQWLGFMRCSVILLSATLTEEARRSFAGAFRGRRTLPQMQMVAHVKYPRITVVQRWEKNEADIVRAIPIPVPQKAKKVFKISTIGTTLESLIEKLEKIMKKGGCVCIYRNLVFDAQSTYLALKKVFVDKVYLLHARTSPGWRKEAEDKIMQMFGKKGNSRPHCAIVVATQVLEQSLDVDFDVIFSDLAPIDFILQRMGRCHRHLNMVRPKSLLKPHLYLMADKLSKGEVPDYGKHIFVYNEYLLHRTYLRLVRCNCRRINIPGDVQDLINDIYSKHNNKWLNAKWKQELKDCKGRMDASNKKAATKAIWGMIPNPAVETGILNPLFNSTPPGLEDDVAEPESVECGRPLYIGWRRGVGARNIPPNVQVVFLKKVDGGYALPEINGESIVFDPKQDFNGELLQKICDCAINVVHSKVVDYCMERREDPPAVWQTWNESFVLRYLEPIVVNNDWEATINGLNLQLSRELGLLIG